MTRYRTTWLLATGLFLLVVAVTNLLVDPYGIFRLVDSEGFNRIKPAAATRGPMAKAYQVLRVQPKTLILGNSRAEVGLDPNFPGWPQSARPVYNAALPGTGTATSLRYLRHVLDANAGSPGNQPTLVLWGVDFMDFLVDPNKPSPTSNTTADNAESNRLMTASEGKRWRQRLRDYAESTLTLAALMDSLQTLANQRNPYAIDLTPLGFNPMHDYIKISTDEGYWSVFHQKDLQYEKTFERLPKGIFSASGDTSSHWEDLKEIMRLCRQHGIELRLFTYPYHVHMLDTFRKTGHAQKLELWKLAIAKAIADEAIASGKAPYLLWDFSTLNSAMAEPVPPKGDHKSSMRWYWESGHFKSELGNQMLEQILTPKK